mmetsp:Transcript_25283/g.60782  ORF Transcript_25283/g.60782 Transcript_25283/m.60782 type:complete len:1028 (+) Transcript_25283:177-3260(+)
MSLFFPDRLLGRVSEESILLNSYFASLSMGVKSPAAVILIQGDSGLGKTKLAESLRPHVVGDDGYFIKGKFDQLSYGSANRPYQGIASVFAEYCSAVEQRSHEDWIEVAEKLRREIDGDEGKILFEAIPSLRKIICGEPSSQKESDIESRPHFCEECQHLEEVKVDGVSENFSESGSNRLNYLIKRFVSVISSIGDPIVLLIDDIQWANKTDLDVLKAIFLGAQNPFLFIFTCRPVDPNHPFNKIIDEFEAKTEIQLQCLRGNSVRQLVAEILRMDDPEKCTSLANFISRVTSGNPLFVRQQIISLRDEGLLRFGSDGWVWDIEAIEEIDLRNVVNMLTDKMKRLPPLTQQTLKICSCIGSKVDLYIVGLIVRETYCVENSDTENHETLAKNAISIAVQEGLVLVAHNSNALTFAHDSVHEAAYCLLEPEKRASYHLKLGKLLYKTMCPNLFQKHQFTIAAQLARGIELVTDDDRILIAEIFFRAGEKSMKASAFLEAHFFFAKGVQLLRKDDWTKHYRLCCDIWMKAADTAYLTSDYQDMNKCLSIIFEHSKGYIADFLDASIIQVRSLSSRDDPTALDVGIEALRVAGEKFPSRNFALHSLVGLARIRCTMKGKGAEKLLQLPPLADKELISLLRLLHMCVNLSVLWNQNLLPLLCFRFVRLNLTHGMSEAMPSAVAVYGAILNRCGYPLSEAEKYGEIALDLEAAINGNCSSQVTFLTFGSTFTKMKKLSDCLKPLRAGFDSGVKDGDITNAMSCAAVAGWVSFYSGQRLSKVATLLAQLRGSMLSFGMILAIRGNRNYINAVEYCRSNSGAPRFSVPIDPDPDDNIGCKKRNIILNEQAKFLQLFVACIFCDYELAWSTSEKLYQFQRIFAGTIWPYICQFYRGMAALSFFPISKCRKAIGTANLCLKELKKGRRQSKINLSHHACLLEAELAVLKKNYKSAEKCYLLAIEHAALAGVTHEHAYACERLGTYHLSRKNYDAAYRQIREARRLYMTWGSRPKCEMLKKKFPDLDNKELFSVIAI